MSKPKEYSWMTKDKLMLYTFIALLILTGLSVISFGITSLIAAAIAVLVAIGIDTLIGKVATDSQMNTLSAAVFGLIVVLSYTLGKPAMGLTDILPLQAPVAYIFIAGISATGMILFKKLAKRKHVNPAAAAKLLILLPFISTVFLAAEHLNTGPLGVPALTGPIGNTVINNNGLGSFTTYLQNCFSEPTLLTYPDLTWTMLIQKFHGWVGGISSIAVIAVGLALFAICRRYIKWRITATYLATVAVFALALSFVYGDADPLLRIIFHLFIGSSIFLAFFMATDPATTPLTYTGQALFGLGLGALTVLIQTYTGFFGGSILALVIMNLTSPSLDKIGRLRPTAEKKEPKLPQAKHFKTTKLYECIRCGACMRVCCHKLSPILIKDAFDKTKIQTLLDLQANLCEGCGHCSFVCPSRIDLKGSVLRAKAMIRSE